MYRTTKLSDLDVDVWTVYETRERGGMWYGSYSVDRTGQASEPEYELLPVYTERIEHKLIRVKAGTPYYCWTCQGACSALRFQAKPLSCQAQAEGLQ